MPADGEELRGWLKGYRPHKQQKLNIGYKYRYQNKISTFILPYSLNASVFQYSKPDLKPNQWP
jgi:hypothetical protein